MEVIRVIYERGEKMEKERLTVIKRVADEIAVIYEKTR